MVLGTRQHLNPTAMAVLISAGLSRLAGPFADPASMGLEPVQIPGGIGLVLDNGFAGEGVMVRPEVQTIKNPSFTGRPLRVPERRDRVARPSQPVGVERHVDLPSALRGLHLDPLRDPQVQIYRFNENCARVGAFTAVKASNMP